MTLRCLWFPVIDNIDTAADVQYRGMIAGLPQHSDPVNRPWISQIYKWTRQQTDLSNIFHAVPARVDPASAHADDRPGTERCRGC